VGGIVTHNNMVEVVWTCVPFIVLVIVAIPSLALLYFMDEVKHPSVFIKVVGKQWYWTYEYLCGVISNYTLGLIAVSSVDMYINTVELDYSVGLYMLRVTTCMLLPVNIKLLLLISSGDVLHSYTIPAFGLKMDACPGRLNKVGLQISRLGTYYGQCSELCGVNHAYMPICIQTLNTEVLKNVYMW
jgi:heme/copper-type cytochrome/quinol oxidase subunit 2